MLSDKASCAVCGLAFSPTASAQSKTVDRQQIGDITAWLIAGIHSLSGARHRSCEKGKLMRFCFFTFLSTLMPGRNYKLILKVEI
jgi:hypothetical protein